MRVFSGHPSHGTEPILVRIFGLCTLPMVHIQPLNQF